MKIQAVCMVVLAAGVTVAAVVGVNQPAPSLTLERVHKLPAREQPAWQSYLDRSARQSAADHAIMQRELQELGATEATVPPSGRGIPRNRPDGLYASAEASHIADAVVSFQTPAGGWSKNADWSNHARQKGEGFAPNNLSRYLTPGDFDTPHDPKWNYVGTLDNDATNTELRFLAKVAAAAPAEKAAAYRAAFLKGVEYLLAAQYPNGGWPQVWPLEGGYHDAITINDSAMTETLETLERAASGEAEYAFVSVDVRKRAAAAVQKGVACLVAAQIVQKGVRTAWAQQHDALTFAPVSARNYEPAAICSSESSGVLLFLMDLKTPSVPVAAAIHAGVAWLQKSAIAGKAYQRAPEGAKLVDAPGGKPIWSRFYTLDTNVPIFGDRDKSLHDNVEEISRERRNGYSWYNAAPQAALDRYAEWVKSHPIQ